VRLLLFDSVITNNSVKFEDLIIFEIDGSILPGVITVCIPIKFE
jgi:hypothetical protein